MDCPPQHLSACRPSSCHLTAGDPTTILYMPHLCMLATSSSATLCISAAICLQSPLPAVSYLYSACYFPPATFVHLFLSGSQSPATRARICKPFKEPRNRFPAWRAGMTTLFVAPGRHATQAGGIESSESIPSLLKRLQIRALHISASTLLPANLLSLLSTVHRVICFTIQTRPSNRSHLCPPPPTSDI